MKAMRNGIRVSKSKFIAWLEDNLIPVNEEPAVKPTKETEAPDKKEKPSATPVETMDQIAKMDVKEIADIKYAPERGMEKKTTYNYPNPCKDKTIFRFLLNQPQPIKIFVYNLKGEIVWKTGFLGTAGVNRIDWDLRTDSGMKISNGTYVYKVISADKVITKKLVVLN